MRSRCSRSTICGVSSRVGPTSSQLVCQHLTAHEGEAEPHSPDLAGRHFAEIAVEDRQVGPVARRDAALPVVLEGGEGRTRGVGAERFLQGQSLFEMPAAGRLALSVLASHRGVDAGER